MRILRFGYEVKKKEDVFSEVRHPAVKGFLAGLIHFAERLLVLLLL